MKISDMEFENYVVLDFETSGLSPTKSRILQIGLLKVTNGQAHEPISIFMNPNYPEPFAVPGLITELTGISTEMIETGLTQEALDAGLTPKQIEQAWLDTNPKVAMEKMFRIIQDEFIWAHNGTRFDKLFLEAECFRQFLQAPPNFWWFDSAAMFKAWKLGAVHELETFTTFFDFADMVLKQRVRGLKYNLQHCCKTLNLDTTGINWHDASGDVMATHLIIQRMRTVWEAL